MPIGTGPSPGTLKSSGFVSQKGFRVAGAPVLGSLTLNISPSLYFAHRASPSAYPMELWRTTTTTLQSFMSVPVPLFVNRNTSGQAKVKISFGSGESKTILCFPLMFELNHSSGSPRFRVAGSSPGPPLGRSFFFVASAAAVYW